MKDIFKKISELVTAKEKSKFIWLFGLIILTNILEVIGIASIFPFIKLVSDPEVLNTNEWLKRTYDFVGVSESSFLILSGALVLVLLTLSNAASVLSIWFQSRVVWRVSHNIAIRALHAYLYQPYAFFLKKSPSDLSKQLLSEVTTLTRQVLLPLLQMIAKAVLTLFIVSLLIAVNPVVMITMIAFLGITFGVLYAVIRRSLAHLGKKRFALNRLRFKSINEIFNGIKSVKTRGAESFFVDVYSDISERHIKLEPRFALLSAFPTYVIQTLVFGAIIAMILFMLAYGNSLQETLPLLSLYALAGYRLMPAMHKMFNSASVIRYNLPALHAIYDDLQMALPVHATQKEERDVLPFEDRIILENIHFAYEGTDNNVLHGINLSIQKNTSIALIGSSGSGKSTLADILSGLLIPNLGTISVDETEIDAHNLRRWQRKIGYVPQEVTIYDDTVTNNIVFGYDTDNIDMERVIECAKIAQIHEFIVEELEDGYDTLAGEHGIRFSGGQRQRLGLARSFYHNPELLILDEATSALDGITENAVMEAVMQMNHQITIVIIAHRLSTVQDCDQIYMLEHGKIVEQGTYADLIDSNSVFKEMAGVA